MLRGLIARVDELVPLKRASRHAGRIARLLTVATFIDDALRVAFDYEGQVESMVTVGFGNVGAAVLPVIFVLVQVIGTASVLCGDAPYWQIGTITLMLWTAAHPFLYAQQQNVEFLVESVSIIGGLLILLSSSRDPHGSSALHLPACAGDDVAATARIERRVQCLQLAGRGCLSALFVYYALKGVRERGAALVFGAAAGESAVSSLVEGVLVCMLVPLAGLLVVGMRSRAVALVLALATALAALLAHPWLYAALLAHPDEQFTLPSVVGYEGVKVPAWIYASHQRYFFFQQVTTRGLSNPALILPSLPLANAVFQPLCGWIALDERGAPRARRAGPRPIRGRARRRAARVAGGHPRRRQGRRLAMRGATDPCRL